MQIRLKKDEILPSQEQEWLVTNGIGGFACGTITGTPTRKYHALLNATLPAPFGRTVMLNYVLDEVIDSEDSFPLTLVQLQGQEHRMSEWVTEFRVEKGIPVWRYEKNGTILEKSLFLIHKQNTLCISYELIASNHDISMKWRPYFHFRMHEKPVNFPIENEQYSMLVMESRYEIECPNYPKLRLLAQPTPTFVNDVQELQQVFYEMEFLRGYESIGHLKSPGYFTFPLTPSNKVFFMVSTEEWPVLEAFSIKDAFAIEKFRKNNLLKQAGLANKSSIKSKLTLAADQFLMTPITRFQDMVRLQAAGEEVRSIIAGFPWFTDWGRDTMISLEGLTLCTGRFQDAHAILHTFSYYIRDGLIPNMFPDGANQGIYNTADASLWFFHAVDRYIEVTGDADILEFILPRLQDIIHYHLKGTSFGIRADEDGLLIQGEPSYALTWMDAKMGDWIVTPRRGKAVEINALWYNALKLFEKWSNTTLPITERCYESFNEKFWFAEGNYLYDVIEGEELDKDPALRPNQLFAISLAYPVLKKERWPSVLSAVEKELLTPFGLRTLAPSHSKYKPYYHGDLAARDGAYHQGTIWPWLIGPFIDVWLKVNPEKKHEAMQFLEPLQGQLNHSCIGSIAEIYDAQDPYKARGCFAQAWSVAEVLRAICKVSALEKEG